MNFITIDFETANAQRNSPCEIGLTFVENFEIIESKSWLIKPINNEFDYFNIMIHGITPEDVENEPEFATLTIDFFVQEYESSLKFLETFSCIWQ